MIQIVEKGLFIRLVKIVKTVQKVILENRSEIAFEKIVQVFRQKIKIGSKEQHYAIIFIRI